MRGGISSGKVAEYKLAAELLIRGVIPCWPSRADIPYDMVVSSRSRAIRIQVKGTEDSGEVIQARAKTSRGRYTKADTDVIAVYLVVYDLWYFIPMSAKPPVSIYLRPGNPKCKWKRYANAWSYVGAP